jgi:hypothetical protein
VVVWLAVSLLGLLASSLVLAAAVAGLTYALRRQRVRFELGALDDGLVLAARRRVGSAGARTLIFVLKIVAGYVVLLIPPRAGGGPAIGSRVPYGSVLVDILIVIACLLLLDTILDYVYVQLELRLAATRDAKLVSIAREDDG